MKTKFRRQVEIKGLSEDGTFEGILSPYGNVDGGGDVVVKGAYTKTLKDSTKRPLLWQHKADVPIGELELEDHPEGLMCKGRLLLDLPEAKKAYLLIKAGVVRGLSIGFEAVKDSIAAGVRQLHEIKLYEGSIVTFPMNEAALITSVKGNRDTKSDFVDELSEIQLCDAAYQMRSALSCALNSVIWANLTREQKITATETIIDQFRDAYMAYIPMYLDMMTEMYGGDMETWSAKRFETKEGRKLSAATKSAICQAHDQMKSAVEILAALTTEEAVDDTSAEGAAATKSEPDFHSAVKALETMRALIPVA